MRKIASLLFMVMALHCFISANAQCTDPPMVSPVNNVVACSFQNLSIIFTGTPGATFQWTNSNNSIGIPSIGFGNINRQVFAFTETQVATITVTPFLAGCPGQPITFTITVNLPTPVVLPEIGTICRNAPPIQLPTSPGGITGNWSGIGVNNNIFNPSFSLGDPIQLLFAPNLGQCASFNTITVEFYPPLLTFVSGLPGPYCAASDSANLNGVIMQTNGIPAPGFWTGNGMISDLIFSPSSVGPGNYNLTFTTIAACPDVIPFNVQVDAAAIPTLVPASLGPYCTGATPASLPEVRNQGFPVMGEWTPAIISTATAGTTN